MSEALSKFVLRGAQRTFLLRVVGLGVSFLSHSYFAGLLGKEEYGTYAYVLAWISVLALAATMGTDTLLTRLLAVYRGSERWAELRGLYGWARNVSTAAAAVLVVAVGGLLAAVFRPEDPSLRATFWVGLPLVLVLTLKSVRQGALKGLRLVVLSETLDNLLRPVVLLCAGFLYAKVLADVPRAQHLMGANLTATAAALLVAMVLVGRVFPREARAVAPRSHDREWLRTALPLLATAGIYLLLSRTDILMLGMLSGRGAAGVYAVVTRFSDLMMLGLVSSTAMIGPVSAELEARGDRAGMQGVVTRSVRWSSALTLLMGVGLVAFGPLLLRMFGEEYVVGYAPMTVLLVGQAFNALAGPVGYLLSMTGHQNHVVRVLAGSALLNVALNALLIPRFGVLGAATATCATNVIWNVLLMVAVRRRLGIDPTALGRGAHGEGPAT